MAVTIPTIISLLPSRVFTSLTGGETVSVQDRDAKVTLAINNGIAYVTAFLAKYKIDYQEDHKIIQRAVSLMAIYELYSYVENEEIAQDKKLQAEELLVNTFGLGQGSSSSGGSSSGDVPAQGTAYRMPLASVQARQKIQDKVR